MSSPSSKSIDHWSYPPGEKNRKSKGVHTPSNWIQAKPSFRCTENLTWLHLICHVSSKFLYIHMHIIIARLRSAHKKFNNPFMCVWLGIMQRANRSDLIGKLTFWYSNVYTCNDLNKIISFAYKKKMKKKMMQRSFSISFQCVRWINWLLLNAIIWRVNWLNIRLKTKVIIRHVEEGWNWLD